MSHEYRFTVEPERTERAFFHVFLLAYPSIVFRFLFCRMPSVETLSYILISPLLALRNLLSAYLSHAMALSGTDYHLTLETGYFSFGVSEDADKHLANSYEVIQHVFKSRGCWTFLTHDGWMVFLPPDAEGEEAVSFVRAKQAEHSQPLQAGG